MRFVKHLALLPLLILVSCSTTTDESVPLNLEGSFAGESLDGRRIFELKAFDGILYAGTDNNMYRRAINDSSWQPMGLNDSQVRTFIIFSEQYLLATMNIDDRDSLTIAKTSDGGQSWSPFRNGYGGNVNRRIPYQMSVDPSNHNIIFAAGPGGRDIAKSKNRGESWDLVSGSWEDLGLMVFIKVNKKNSDQVWAGGMTAGYTPSMFKSDDGGDNWQRVNILENLETTVYDVETHPSDLNRVLAGLGGGIIKSTNGGQNWQPVLKDVNIYSMTKSAKDNRTVYASGENLSGKLVFWASGDFGDTWQRVEWAAGPSDLFVLNIISVMQGGQEVLYLGTNKGVYSYTFE